MKTEVKKVQDTTARKVQDTTARKVQDMRRAEEKSATITGRSFPPRHGAKRRAVERFRTQIADAAKAQRIAADDARIAAEHKPWPSRHASDPQTTPEL